MRPFSSHLATLGILVTVAQASMIPEQITGNYALARFCPTCQSNCPSNIYVRAAEVVSASTGTLYVVAHSNIYFRRFASDPGVRCSVTKVASREGLTVSSTVLRRMDQVTVNRSVDILAAFYNVPDDVFFIGYEVGERKCGAHVTPSSTISLWAVPSRPVRGSHNGRTITFRPGVKYLYYFNSVEPCLYEGNPAETGKARTLDKRASAVAGDPSAVNPNNGSVTDSGTVITSSGAQSIASPSPPAAAAPAAPAPAPAPGTATPASSGKTRTAKDNPECLTGSGLLERPSGVPLRVANARVGDVVASGRDPASGALQFSTIFAFSHSDRDAVSERPLVSLSTASNATVLVTGGHLVPVLRCGKSGSTGFCLEKQARCSKRLVAARDVRPLRDSVYDVRLAQWTPVLLAEERNAVLDNSGLFNPHTEVGTIVVDGVVVSCLTTALPVPLAKGLLWVAKIVYNLVGQRGTAHVETISDFARMTYSAAWRRSDALSAGSRRVIEHIRYASAVSG